jgi:predicted amidohydrolase
VHPTPLGKLGVAICYDLRFPEAVRGLRLQGAHIVAAPCAFFTFPGERQWEAIIRTRAIDNQCYMLVAAQWGEYAPNRRALGFSMIVDPIGDVLAKCEPGEGVATADINPEFADQWRYNFDYIAQARMLPARLFIKKAENQ